MNEGRHGHGDNARKLAGGRANGKEGKRRGPYTSGVRVVRQEFVGRLLDRGATRQQVIDALMKPKSDDPGKPGGLGLNRAEAEYAILNAQEKRRVQFAEESQRERAEQYHRLRGHIGGAVAAKQFGPVAANERLIMDLVGTRAPAPQVPRPERHEQIAAVLAGMSNERTRELAAASRARAAKGKDEDDDE